MVDIIRASQNREEAKQKLQARFGFTDLQVNAILEMRLYQLTGLERGRLADELAKLLATIEELKSILADPEKIYAIIRADLADLRRGTAPRTTPGAAPRSCPTRTRCR